MLKAKKKKTSNSKRKKEQARRNAEAAKIARQNKTLSPKEQYKANKKQGIVFCPKCGSQNITVTNKKISLGKGIAGAAIGSMVNPVGTVVGGAVGATSSKKIYNVCMNCGYKWKP